jgi:hypothetical protein
MRKIISGIAVSVMLAVTVATTSGQSALPAPTTAPAVTLDEVDQLRVAVVRLSDQLATCQQTKQTADIRMSANNLQLVVEKKYPGMTIDWATGALVKKVTPAKPAQK